MAKGLEICAAVLLFFAGLLVLLYPVMNGARLENASQEAVESFIDALPIPRTAERRPICTALTACTT